MDSQITLQEAAQLLGVSKETLRNWDRAGKLTPTRNPLNRYRTYSLEQLLHLKESLNATEPLEGGKRQGVTPPGRMTEELFKRHLAKLHRSLRDAHGDSSLIARFEEITKLLFTKALSEQSPETSQLFMQLVESDASYADRVKAFYRAACERFPELVPQRFRNLNLPMEAIVQAGTVLAELRLSDAAVDVKGVAYEEVVKNTFDKGDNQQFFTPREIASFLVSMLQPHLKGAVCDPASGTGGFLVEILRRKINPASLTAFEIDERLAWVTGVNLLLSGAENFTSTQLGNGGSLGVGGRSYCGKFDAIITNPPFGSDFSDKELSEYELGKGFTSRRRGILFLERCLDLLKPGGILGMIIDEGVLSLSSAQDVREFIARKSELLAVVSLPETAFMPYALVNTSILVMRKSKHPSPGPTFFARSEKVGRKPNGEPDTIYDNSGNPISNSDLPELLDAWKEFQAHGRCAADPERVFLANPFLDSSDNRELRLDFRFHHPARHMAASAIKQSKYPVVSLGEICQDRGETIVPSVDFAEQFIYYTGLAQIESRTGNATQILVPAQSLKSSVKRYEPGDILFARMRPNLRKCHFVEFSHAGYTSSECFVLRVRENSDGNPKFDPFLLSVLLRSDFVYGQIMHQVAGIGRPRLGSKDFKHILIPVPPPAVQAAMKEAFLKSQETYKALETQAAELQHQADSLKLQAIENIARNLCGSSK